MTTQAWEHNFSAGVLSNAVVRPTIITVTATDNSWSPLGSNLTANTVGYIEIYGVNFGLTDLVCLDEQYIASSVVVANVNILRATLPNTVPAGSYDVYVVKSTGRYSVKTSGISYS